MALDTYANLKTSLATWLARADVSADVDDMIDMFEAWVNRNLRMPQMEVEAIAQASEYLQLPVGFMEMRDIQYQANPVRQLEYLTPTMADLQDPCGTTGIPRFYTIVGDQIRLVPAPSDSNNVRMAYWQKVPALSDTNTSNWMLSMYPDAYLYGSLTHGALRIHDPDLATQMAQGWSAVMQEMKRQGRLSNVGSLLRIRAA